MVDSHGDFARGVSGGSGSDSGVRSHRTGGSGPRTGGSDSGGVGATWILGDLCPPARRQRNRVPRSRHGRSLGIVASVPRRFHSATAAREFHGLTDAGVRFPRTHKRLLVLIGDRLPATASVEVAVPTAFGSPGLLDSSLHGVGAGPSPHFSCAVERRFLLVGANPTRQLSLQPVAVGAVQGGNELD